MGVRNVGAGMAPLHGWRPYGSRVLDEVPLADSDGFRNLSIDLNVAPRDSGYFEGAIRDADDAIPHDLVATINERRPFKIDLLYGDQQARRRTASRFTVLPAEEDGWFCRAARPTPEPGQFRPPLTSQLLPNRQIQQALQNHHARLDRLARC